jgi:hypothetical protein
MENAFYMIDAINDWLNIKIIIAACLYDLFVNIALLFSNLSWYLCSIATALCQEIIRSDGNSFMIQTGSYHIRSNN